MSKKTYTDEFKDESAKTVIDSGRSVKEVAEEIGVNRKTLDNWVRARRESTDDIRDIPSPRSPEPAVTQKFKRQRIRAWRRVGK